ncbi:hypothetical protein NKW55_13920 [Gluconobacter kondonii]|uniref:Uncharacterized protein n=1 Tax=Gluconobacter kondonii TaxID=941463 RepID=A0ABQ5WUQ4_9PROT|nr:hypothetical protein [Gluconobacter kondonii]MCP1237682.1 hypothetical protein [Gluconobacter kondonii]GBR29966.1 hypothetical protein AA3266_0318 [Gluconobacter kondonii NBRC 3266]GLQ66620.1 hypothetical protein GCM10007870_22040 [Gluconobacter kondonii]
MTAPSIAAIDSRDTKTLIVVLHQNGSPGPVARACRTNLFDRTDWRSVLRSLLAQISTTIVALFLGLAGYGDTCVLGISQKENIGEVVSYPFHITNDVDMACTGAFGEQACFSLQVRVLLPELTTAWNTMTGLLAGEVCFGDGGSAFRIGRHLTKIVTIA